MRAAQAMNFNPASVFLNVRAYTTELDCAMLLGRAERGIGAMFKPEQIARLKRFMALGETAACITREVASRMGRVLCNCVG